MTVEISRNYYQLVWYQMIIWVKFSCSWNKIVLLSACIRGKVEEFLYFIFSRRFLLDQLLYVKLSWSCYEEMAFSHNYISCLKRGSYFWTLVHFMGKRRWCLCLLLLIKCFQTKSLKNENNFHIFHLFFDTDLWSMFWNSRYSCDKIHLY